MSSEKPISSATHTDLRHAPLGRQVAGREYYDPGLLFPLARASKRHDIGIDGAALPFVGEDLWNAWELSWLNGRGKPIVATGVFRVPANSSCLIESKSLKLYLNSFHQTVFASAHEVAQSIARDLSRAAGTEVAVTLTPLTAGQSRQLGVTAGTLLDDLDIDVGSYASPQAALLCADALAPVVDETLYSHLLKSNCLVTGQPDWGTLFVRYRGRPIDPAGLLRYIVSFRRHHEFHEHCVERVFVDIRARCAPERLEVWARYTRRGGLDINPWRSSEPGNPPPNCAEIRQ